MTDREMLKILKCKVMPQLNISFDKFVLYHGMKSIYVDKFWRYSVWEVYLNILIREYQIPVDTLADMMKNAICTQKEENRKKHEQIMEKYYQIINSKTWLD